MSDNKVEVEKVRSSEPKKATGKIGKRVYAFSAIGGAASFIVVFILIALLSSGKSSASGKPIEDISQVEMAAIEKKMAAISSSSSANPAAAGQAYNPGENVDSFLKQGQQEKPAVEEPPVEPVAEENLDEAINRTPGTEATVDPVIPPPSKKEIPPGEEPSMVVFSRSTIKEKVGTSQLGTESFDKEKVPTSGLSIGGRGVPGSPGPAQSSRKKTEMETVIYNDLPPVTIFEGEFLEAIIINQIVSGVADSPVVAAVAKDYFDQNQKYVVIPAGSRVVGSAGVVAQQDQERMIVTFHRIILPNGQSIYVEKDFKGLNRDGSVGVASSVNNHVWKRYSSAILFGLLDGLGAFAQNKLKQTSSTSFFVDRTSSNFDQINNQIFSRYQNMMPTITVKSGHKVKIYISEDILISPYMPIKERGYAK